MKKMKMTAFLLSGAILLGSCGTMNNTTKGGIIGGGSGAAAGAIIGGLFGMRFPFISEGAMPCTNCLSNDALFKVQSDIIRRLAAEKSCVFVGRCADYILREHPRCANVFISATKEDRIARLCQMHRIDEEAAEEMIEKADKRRSEYYNYYSYKTWGAAATYHLCVDSSSLGIEETVRFVEEFVAKKLQIGM